MRQRGQASCEWGALLCVVAGAVAALGAVVAHALAAITPADADAALAQRWAPRVVFERGMRDHPVDPRVCRARACAEAPGPPVLFTHVVRRGATTYVQYWAYWPD